MQPSNYAECGEKITIEQPASEAPCLLNSMALQYSSLETIFTEIPSHCEQSDEQGAWCAETWNSRLFLAVCDDSRRCSLSPDGALMERHSVQRTLLRAGRRRGFRDAIGVRPDQGA